MILVDVLNAALLKCANPLHMTQIYTYFVSKIVNLLHKNVVSIYLYHIV